MNLVKASAILYPILGENVGDIVLSYVIPDKYKYTGNNHNLHEFFNDNDLDSAKIDETFDNIKRIHSENECNRGYMKYEGCTLHGRACYDDVDEKYDLYSMLFRLSSKPEWLQVDAVYEAWRDYAFEEQLKEIFIGAISEDLT